MFYLVEFKFKFSKNEISLFFLENIRTTEKRSRFSLLKQRSNSLPMKPVAPKTVKIREFMKKHKEGINKM